MVHLCSGVRCNDRRRLQTRKACHSTESAIGKLLIMSLLQGGVDGAKALCLHFTELNPERIAEHSPEILMDETQREYIISTAALTETELTEEMCNVYQALVQPRFNPKVSWNRNLVRTESQIVDQRVLSASTAILECPPILRDFVRSGGDTFLRDEAHPIWFVCKGERDLWLEHLREEDARGGSAVVEDLKASLRVHAKAKMLREMPNAFAPIVRTAPNDVDIATIRCMLHTESARRQYLPTLAVPRREIPSFVVPLPLQRGGSGDGGGGGGDGGGKVPSAEPSTLYPLSAALRRRQCASPKKKAREKREKGGERA